MAFPDFTTGKLIDVARAQRPSRRREYLLLGIVFLGTSIPYAVALTCFPKPTILVIASVLLFKIMAAFIASSTTGVSHHVRFLLAGSNPFGMAAASSTLFGGVDALMDWREDREARGLKRWNYWLTTSVKFLITPVGSMFLMMELLWDLVLLRRSVSIAVYKWHELFSVAYYHDLICPEKSNDLFYADLAFARYEDNAFLYQWNRMRALVFELQHYIREIADGLGDAESNLFCAGDLVAYQILKRLQVERIEELIKRHFDVRPHDFPIPYKIANQLVNNARPLQHYLDFRQRLLDERQHADLGTNADRQLHQILSRCLAAKETAVANELRYVTWHVLRLLDEEAAVFSPGVSRYITGNELAILQRSGIVKVHHQGKRALAYCFTRTFLREFERFLQKSCVVVSDEQRDELLLRRSPNLVCYQGSSHKVRP